MNKIQRRAGDFIHFNFPLFKGLVPLLSLAVASLLMAGCSTVEPGHHYGVTPLSSLKTAYVVVQKDYDPKIGADIQEALAMHNVAAQVGPLEGRPMNVDFYVEYEDHWRWDMAMYLFSLDVRFINSASGNIIGSGSFKQGAFHDFPNAREKAIAVVNNIYLAP